MIVDELAAVGEIWHQIMNFKQKSINPDTDTFSSIIFLRTRTYLPMYGNSWYYVDFFLPSFFTT